MVTNEVQSKVEDKSKPMANITHPSIIGKANATSKKDT